MRRSGVRFPRRLQLDPFTYKEIPRTEAIRGIPDTKIKLHTWLHTSRKRDDLRALCWLNRTGGSVHPRRSASACAIGGVVGVAATVRATSWTDWINMTRPWRPRSLSSAWSRGCLDAHLSKPTTALSMRRP